MSNFRIGQKVVYIGTDEYYPKKSYHVIKNIFHCKCGDIKLDCGYTMDGIYYCTECHKCSNLINTNIFWKSSIRFRPLSYSSNVNMEVITLFQPTEEKTDVPAITPEKTEAQ